jgi:hypothetical protein
LPPKTVPTHVPAVIPAPRGGGETQGLRVQTAVGAVHAPAVEQFAVKMPEERNEFALHAISQDCPEGKLSVQFPALALLGMAKRDAQFGLQVPPGLLKTPTI